MSGCNDIGLLCEKLLVEREHSYSASVHKQNERVFMMARKVRMGNHILRTALLDDANISPQRKDTNDQNVDENCFTRGISKYYCSSGAPYDPDNPEEVRQPTGKTKLSIPRAMVKGIAERSKCSVHTVNLKRNLGEKGFKDGRSFRTTVKPVSKPAAERSLEQYLERLNTVNVNEILCKLQADGNDTLLTRETDKSLVRYLDKLDTLHVKMEVGGTSTSNKNNTSPGTLSSSRKGSILEGKLAKVYVRSFANKSFTIQNRKTIAGRNKSNLRQHDIEESQTKLKGSLEAFNTDEERIISGFNKGARFTKTLSKSGKGTTSARQTIELDTVVQLSANDVSIGINNQHIDKNTSVITLNTSGRNKNICQESVKTINVDTQMGRSEVKKYARLSESFPNSGKGTTSTLHSIKQDLQRLINDRFTSGNETIDVNKSAISLSKIQKEKSECRGRVKKINVDKQLVRSAEVRKYPRSSEIFLRSGEGENSVLQSIKQDLQRLINDDSTNINKEPTDSNKTTLSRGRIENGNLERKSEETVVNLKLKRRSEEATVDSGSWQKAKSLKIGSDANFIEQSNKNGADARLTYNMAMLLEEGWCRTCATKRFDTIPILGKAGVELNLLEKLKSLAESGKKWDMLPMQMCMNCVWQLDICSKFVNQMNTAEATLYAMMNRSHGRENSPKLTTNPDKSNKSDLPGGLEKFVAYSNRAIIKSESCYVPVQSEASEELSKFSDGATSCSNYLFVDSGAPSLNSDKLLYGESNKDGWMQMGMGDNTKIDNVTDTSEVTNTTEEEFINEICCDFCFKTFKTKGEASEHENVHMNEVWPTVDLSSSCEYCVQLFPTNNELDEHQSTVHSTQIGSLCETCGKLCNNQFDLWKHCLVDHPKHGPLECSYCSKIYPSESKLQFHIVEAHPEIVQTEEIERSNCNICGALIYTECLASHMKSHEVALQFKCDQCNTSFESKAQIERHIAFHTGVCPRCDKKFSSATFLQTHLTRHDIGSYPCMQCGEAFYTRDTFQRHQHSHKEQRKTRFSFPCKLCNEFFTKGSLLWEHQKTHTRAERDEYYKQMTQCERCERCFITKVHCQLHMMLVHNSRKGDLSCLICSKVSANIQELKQHTTIHRREIDSTRKLKGKCDYCGLYMTRGGLISHMTTAHSNLPDIHVCHVCGKQIKRLDNFRNHIRVHEGEKRYKCHVCGMAFVHYTVRETHICKEHPEHMTERQSNRRNRKKYRASTSRYKPCRIYKCPQCLEVFASYRARMTHVVKIHPASSKAQSYKEVLRKNREVIRKMKYKCNFCHEVFATYDGRRYHVVREHPDSDKATEYNKALERLRELKKKYKHRCNVCRKEFNNHYQRRAHVLKKHPDSEQACTYKRSGPSK